MKKRLFMVWLFSCLICTLITSTAFATETPSGTCGDNLTWTLGADGKLTIRGTGKITNYTEDSPAPWYDYRESIVSAVLEKGITDTGDRSFINCVNLTSVSLPDTLKTIGGNSFANCAKLDNVNIPDSVTTIYSGAFMSTALSSMTIPVNVTTISRAAFAGCTGLTAIKVASGNKNYSTRNGVLYNHDKTQLLCYPAGKDGAFTLPNGVTEIQDYAFYGASKLTTILLRNGVTKIGKWTFACCSEITSIYLPKYTTLIDEHAFYSCDKLEKVTIPKTVTEIALHAFEYCSALENAYYAGSQSEWEKVKIGERNEAVSSVVKFNSPTYTCATVATSNEGSTSYDGMECLPNTIVIKTPPSPPEGYRFGEWGGLSGLEDVKENAKTSQVKFTMPAHNVTLTAQFIPSFVDVPEDAYFYKPVQWAVSKGITNGTTKTTFSPGNVCTTANILTFLWRANESPEPNGANPFSNVDSSVYYAKAAAWAYEKGMISGKTFDGNAPCTRAATMKYLWILAGRPKTGKLPFKDVDPKADYAWAVAWAVDSEITKGKTDTTFAPDDTCTRGQIVTFLYRHYA